MPFSVGELCETSGEVEVEWKIANFLSYCKQLDKSFLSPDFYFSDTVWYLKICLNASTKYKAIELKICRMSGFPAFSITYSLSLIQADGTKVKINERENVTFDMDNRQSDPTLIMFLSDLEKERSSLAPCGVFTITCTMKHCNRTPAAMSLIRRLLKLSTNLKNIFTGKKRTDVVLKVKEREFPAHRVILESQSPVFNAMFHHDMKENKTGVVRIHDIHPDIFERVLFFMYSGTISRQTEENVCQIYAAADVYQLTDLKQLCRVFIEDNFSVNLICEVIKFADLYKEEELGRRAKKYFKENLGIIIETDHWKVFARENPELSLEFLSFAVKELTREKQ